VIDWAHFRDDAVMFPRSWPVLVSGVACALGCAASQVDDMPSNSDPDDTPTAGKPSGGGGAGGTSSLPKAGTTSAIPKAGTTSTGGTSSGTAGTGPTGGAGGGAGGGSGGTAVVPAANTNLPFSEDFEDGQANGFMAWNEDATQGAWAVVADGPGKVYQPAAPVGDLEFGVGGSTKWTDVAMTVKVRLNDDSAGAQIVARFKDPKTYLVVEMAIGKYKLRARSDGSTVDLISPSPKPVIVSGKWYTVGITAKGTTVTLTLDGMPIGAPVMCDALISNGGIALGTAEGTVSFDDVSVTAAP
jgi:hypothetical protein